MGVGLLAFQAFARAMLFSVVCRLSQQVEAAALDVRVVLKGLQLATALCSV